MESQGENGHPRFLTRIKNAWSTMCKWLKNAKQKIDEQKGFVAKVGGACSAGLATASDFFKPILNFTLFFLITLGVIFILSGIIRALASRDAIAARINHFLEGIKAIHWFEPFMAATATAFWVFFGSFMLNDDAPDGFLAEHVQLAQTLQDSLGIANKHLADISKHTESTAENTSAMLEEQRKTVELLREMASPTDARKKLGQLGLKFDAASYADKLREGDLDVIELFYKGGMSPTVLDANGESPLFNCILNKTPNISKILELAIKDGLLDPNKRVSCKFPVQKVGAQTYSFYQASHELDPVSWFPGLEADLGVLPYPLGMALVLNGIQIPEDYIELIKKYDIHIKNGILIREEISRFYKDAIEQELDAVRKFQLSQMRISKKIESLRGCADVLPEELEKLVMSAPPLPSFPTIDGKTLQFQPLFPDTLKVFNEIITICHGARSPQSKQSYMENLRMMTKKLADTRVEEWRQILDNQNIQGLKKRLSDFDRQTGELRNLAKSLGQQI